MENKKEKREITFWKILVAVIVIGGAVALWQSFFGSRGPRPLRAVMGGETFIDSDVDTMAGDMVSAPMPEVMPSVPRAVSNKMLKGVRQDKSEMNNDGAVVEKKVIKNGSLRLKVESTEDSAEKIKEIAKQYKGEVANVNLYRQGKNGLGGNLTVKVPVDQFESAMKAIKAVGDQVLSESVSSSDVTEEYVDLQAQIRNKKAEEETFRNLLERSGKLDDVLSVTREVARVRGEIDRLEGRIKFMESQTDMSRINVSLVEYEQVANTPIKWKPARVAQKALHNLVLNFQKAINGIIYFTIATLPTLIIIALIIFVFYKIVKIILKKVLK